MYTLLEESVSGTRRRVHRTGTTGGGGGGNEKPILQAISALTIDYVNELNQMKSEHEQKVV
jgi:hypothetical protein